MGILNYLAQKKSVRSLIAAMAFFAGVTTAASAGEKDDAEPQKTEQKTKTLDEKMKIVDKLCLTIVRNNLTRREGKVPYFYIDSEGNWSTYIGLNVDSLDILSQLDIVDKDGNFLDKDGKKDLYDKMCKIKEEQRPNGFNYKAKHYENSIDSRPTEDSCIKVFDNHLENDLASAKGDLGLVLFYNLHPYAQAEIVEKYYNLGFGKFTPEIWKKFFAAARKLSYSGMAAESHVSNISEERNESTAKALRNIPGGDGYKTGFGDEVGRYLFNSTYTVLKDCSVFDGALGYGVWNGKGCVKIGNSFPITKDVMKKLPLAECGVEIPDVDTFCNALLKQKKQSAIELPETLMCKAFEEFFKDDYNQRCRSLFRTKHINLDEVDPIARVVAINIDIATNKKLEKYNNFLAAVKKKNWKEAARQSKVSWTVFKSNNPFATEDQWKSFNSENERLLLSLNAQNTKSLQIAMANTK